MSRCISMHGEFSEHILDDVYICTRCAALDEDALIDEVQKLRRENEQLGKVISKAVKVIGKLKKGSTPRPGVNQ